MGFLDSIKSIKQKIVTSLRSSVEVVFRRAGPKIEKRIVSISPELFKQTDTYESLVGGSLNHEFGFEMGTAQTKVDAVLEAISQIIQVRITTPIVEGERLQGSIEVFLDPFELETVFSMEEAQIETEKGATLNWLEWLLSRGNEIIIGDYFYLAIPSPYSRSGVGIMVKNKVGKTYKVNSSYAGTLDDNWITRSLFNKDLLKVYSRIIKEEVESA